MSLPTNIDLKGFESVIAAIPESYVTPFERAWRHRELIRAVVRREYLSRFSGSMLGWVWAVVSPLGMLLTYTALFYLTVPQLAGGMSVSAFSLALSCSISSASSPTARRCCCMSMQTS